MDERYLEKRMHIEKFFIPENLKPDSGKLDISPSGKFRIEITRYFTLPNRWEYSRGIVTSISDGKVIADIKRNYGHFWHTWVPHPNGNEYLLCGEDYQGYSVLNLNTEKFQVYFPEEGYKGAGFCWVSVLPSPDGLVLAVDGCYWACPYDLVFLDFRKPEVLPYPQLARFEALNGCDGWINNDTFVFKSEVVIRKSDGVAYKSLPEDEQEILDNDATLMDFRSEIVHFRRLSF